jgi:PTH1 family peptidyl-tRNA hydrolase
MLLFCFLGNIGKEYQTTRHNAGWWCEAFWAQHFGWEESKSEPKFFCSIRKGNCFGISSLFIKPNTYMNLSGKALLAVSQFYKIPIENILLIYDDVDLDFGTVRFRKNGSSGGHNGVKDCIRVMGTDTIARIKIGVKTNAKEKFSSTADFVLGNFSAEEQRELSENILQKTLPLLEEFVDQKNSFINWSS